MFKPIPELRPLFTGFAVLFCALFATLFLTGGEWQSALAPLAMLAIARALI